MNTPNTKAGELTENVMARVRDKLRDLPTHEYNRVYEAVLEEMTCIVRESEMKTKTLAEVFAKSSNNKAHVRPEQP